MSQHDHPKSPLQRIARVVALGVSLSLAITLIIQAQRDVDGVVAQDRPQAQSNQAPSEPSNTSALDNELFDPPKLLGLDHSYAIELIPEPAAKQRAGEPQELKLHKTNTARVRHLKDQVVKRLEALRDQTEVAGLTTEELLALKKLSGELKRNARVTRSRFAHTSKSMAPKPRSDVQPIPVDPQTLAALKTLVALKP